MSCDFVPPEVDPKRLLEAEPPVLIDQWQRLPQTWDLVRRAVDAGAGPGQFLLTGSVSPEGSVTHSGAARIPTLRMRPLSLVERTGTEGSVSLSALLGGSRSALSGETELGHEVRNRAGLRRWMAAYAAASSTTTTYEKIRDAATSNEGEKVNRKTVAAAKHQLADPALAARPGRHLAGRPLRVAGDALRSGLRAARRGTGQEERIGDELLDAIVITTGEAAYRRPDGIGVVPASLLGA